MHDQSKTNQELHEELSVLKQRIRELEESATKCKRFEVLLKKTEQDLSIILNSTSSMIWQKDQKGTYQQVNKAYCETVGLSKDDILGKTDYDLFPKDIADKYVSHDRNVLNSGISELGIEEYHVRSSGEYGWSSTDKYIYYNADGNPSGTIGFATDITDRKCVERELRENEEKYRGIFDESVAAIYIFDNKKNFINSNQAGLDLLGYSREELLHLSIPDVDADPLVVLPAHEELLSGGRLINYEHKLRRKDNTTITVLNNSRPIKGSIHGNIVGMLSTLVDITDRKQAEDRLRESELKYSNYVEYAPDGVFVANEKGRYLEVNKNACLMTGYTEEELLQMSIPDLLSDEFLESGLANFENLVKTGISKGESQFNHKDGSKRWWSVDAVKLSETRFLGFTKDITKRKHMETALQESESKYRNLFDQATDGIMIMPVDGRNFIANKSFANLHGYDSPKEMEHLTLADLDTPESAKLAPDRLRRILAGEPMNFEVEHNKKDGQRISLDVSCSIARIDGKSYIFGFHKDITDRKRAETVLVNSEKRFRKLIQHSSDILVILNEEGVERYLSDSVERITGYTQEECLGVKCFEFLHPDDVHAVMEKFIKVAATPGLTDRVEYRHRHKNGGWVNLEAIGTNLLNDETVRGIVLNVRDNTEKKKAEDEIRKADERLRKLVQNSSDIIVILNSDGTQRYVSPAAEKITGFQPEELTGKSLAEIIHPDDMPTVLQVWKEAITNPGQLLKVEYRHIHKSGGWVHLEAVGQSFFNDPVVNGAITSVRDITKRKHDEDEVRQSELRFRSVFHTTPVGLCIVKDRVFQSANKAWCENFGYSESDFIGHTTRMLYENEDEYERVGRELYTKFPKQSMVTVQTRLKRKDDCFRDAFVTASPVDANDLAAGTVVAIEDITDRKQAEERLRDSEERYKSFIDKSFAGVYVVQNGKFRFLNDNAASFAGYLPEELVGRKADSMVHPEDRLIVKERSKRMLSGGDLSPYEFRIITKDRQLRWIIETVSLIPYRGEKAILGNSMDITDRKRAEEALQASQELEISILQSVPHAIFGVENRRIFFANEAMGEIFGWEPGELIGKSTRVIFRNDHEWETYGAILYSQLKLQQVFVFEWDVPFIRKDGSDIFCRMSVSRSGKELGESRRIVATFEDITERRRIEAENDQKQKLNEMLLNSLPHPTMLVRGRDKVVLAANSIALRAGVKIGAQCWRHLWNAEFVSAKDKTLLASYPDIVPGEFGVKCEFCRGDQCLSELPEQNNPNVEAIGKNWDIYWIKASDDAYLHYAIDITDIKKSEQERRDLESRLQRSEKMEALGTMAGGVAHDLNNVLGIVVGYAEMLMDEMDESSPLKEDVMKIMEGGNRSAAIVQDLLTLARRGVQTQKVINLNDTIRGYQKTPEFEALFSSNRRIKLKTDLETELLNIMGSPVHLGKTFINLATNAVESMPGGGELTIATRNQSLDKPIHGYDAVNEGDYVVLSIADTGEGIFAHDIKHIFEPFYTKKIMGKSGTGLGLAVVWGTVKDHNGYIDVQSEVGKGTTFTLYFPVRREDVAKVDTTMPLSEYIGKDESILVIDDIKEQRELATKMLGKLNYRVKAVSSGEEALEYLKTNKADLLVLDMIMDPGMDGLDTYKAILEIHPKQRAIIVSGFSETERVKETKVLGAGNYLRKPYVIEKLGLAARKELDRQ